MSAASPLTFFMSPVGMFYSVTAPFLLLLLLTLLLLVSTSTQGAKAGQVTRAAFHYIMQGMGIVLMTVGAIPTLTSVLGGPPYPGRIYMSLLWVFLVGGALFLWHEQCAQRIERASLTVVHALFVTTVKTVGYIVALFSGLTLLITVALGQYSQRWWVSPVIMLLYGILLFWSAKESEAADPSFRTAPLHAKAGKKGKKQRRWSGLRLLGKRA
ncbi:hypothetical protein AUJ46_02685 [Candidatus Peregrinibacteria bacterium CG1_02_54_53]|nr:MAG: hypothetical protein AUJ46_02685 [Candidatus Peregrinibacteria bacterium CG1_02_54_53]